MLKQTLTPSTQVRILVSQPNDFNGLQFFCCGPILICSTLVALKKFLWNSAFEYKRHPPIASPKSIRGCGVRPDSRRWCESGQGQFVNKDLLEGDITGIILPWYLRDCWRNRYVNTSDLCLDNTISPAYRKKGQPPNAGVGLNCIWHCGIIV